MFTVNIPGRGDLSISHVVLDYNGTIAIDGRLIDGLAERLEALKAQVAIHVLTADTYGNVRAQCAHLPVEIHTFPRAGAGECKAEIVKRLEGGVICFGNGFNDIPMFDLADLSVATLQAEGLYAGLATHADILITSILDGLDLLLKPDRLRADLRT